MALITVMTIHFDNNIFLQLMLLGYFQGYERERLPRADFHGNKESESCMLAVGCDLF